jgi:hypothetical protein
MIVTSVSNLIIFATNRLSSIAKNKKQRENQVVFLSYHLLIDAAISRHFVYVGFDVRLPSACT